jgi:hypothetical protein
MVKDLLDLVKSLLGLKADGSLVLGGIKSLLWESGVCDMP